MPGTRSDSKEVWELSTRSRNVLRALMAEVRPKRRCVRSHEDPDRGRSPQDVLSRRCHRRSLRRVPRARCLCAGPCRPEVPRALGEEVPRASLGGKERRRSRGKHLAGRLAASGESVVDVPPKLSARVRVLSSFAGNARKNDRLDALATAMAASRKTKGLRRSMPRPLRRRCACSPRGERTSWPSAPGR